ncbi:hypothetical protein LCGC14_1541580 [marine sediment metagenome]|uniref:Uncharacterized protein n=1 Tax=marine sediment metagenome TaxID=412755 RepID=A0A0F9LTP3_9ZZZZ
MTNRKVAALGRLWYETGFDGCVHPAVLAVVQRPVWNIQVYRQTEIHPDFNLTNYWVRNQFLVWAWRQADERLRGSTRAAVTRGIWDRMWHRLYSGGEIQ